MPELNGHTNQKTKLFEKPITWNIDEVSEYTELAKGTIYNLVYLGKIPFVKQRKRLKFIPQEIQKWLLKGD